MTTATRITEHPDVFTVAERFTKTHDTIFMSVAGSHLYGFESKDSDVDLRGCHVVDPAKVLGIFNVQETIEQQHDGDVLVEVVSHDVGKFAGMLLRGNGNALEQLFSPLVVTAKCDCGWQRCTANQLVAHLRDITKGLISWASGAHYRGFSQNCWRDVVRRPTAKRLLYTYRTLLTGIHLMRTGRVCANIDTLMEANGFTPPEVDVLLDLKRDGVETSGYKGPIEPHERFYVMLQGRLDDAMRTTELPNYPSQAAKQQLNDWVVQVRKQALR